MNRRGFLSFILALGAAPAIVRAASLMPGRGIAVATFDDVLAYGDANRTITVITREALRIAHENLSFIGSINRSYESDEQVVRIRRPQLYTGKRVSAPGTYGAG